ncbi:MAG: biopolymer transporter ExbD [Ectothiorhodospiraceae bacterium]|nr:biopolymer transporter ExbD [Ectothiorhodospiraceae bacterium]
MKMSRRARRMQQHHQRAKRSPGFNLVALMDIFTILVFFLLVNSSDVQEIASSRMVELPDSVVDARPRETVMVTVSEQNILLNDRVVASTGTAAGTELVIEPLREALEQYAARSGLQRPASEDLGEITIMGDRRIPFTVLRKVMATCTEAGFSRVSLAVMQTAAGDGGP